MKKPEELFIEDTEIELGTKVYNCLKNAHMHTVGDILKHSRADFLALNGFGRVSVAELEAALFTLGLSLPKESGGEVKLSTVSPIDCEVCKARNFGRGVTLLDNSFVKIIAPVFQTMVEFDDLYETKLPNLIKQIESYESQIANAQARLEKLKLLVSEIIKARSDK